MAIDVREVVVDANHTVVLASGAFVSGDQFTGSIPLSGPFEGGSN
jgi:hypothetical protein